MYPRPKIYNETCLIFKNVILVLYSERSVLDFFWRKHKRTTMDTDPIETDIIKTICTIFSFSHIGEISCAQLTAITETTMACNKTPSTIKSVEPERNIFCHFEITNNKTFTHI